MRNHVWFARIAIDRGLQSGHLTGEQARQLEAVLRGRRTEDKETRRRLLREFRALCRREGWKPKGRNGKPLAPGAGPFWTTLVSILRAIDWAKVIEILLAVIL